MNRKLKAFGVTLVAAFALSAVVAQGALAIPFTSPERSGTQQTFLKGEKTSEHVFTTSAGEVVCSTISFLDTAPLTGSSTTETEITPSYSGCTAFGFATTDVKMNGCTYLFTAPTTEPSSGVYQGEPPHVKCPPEKSIEITPTLFGISVCTATIAAQTPTSGKVLYSNNTTAGTGMDINVNAEAEGIHYTSSNSSCGPTGTTNTNGVYKGKVTLKGYTTSARNVQTGITVN